MFWVDKYRPKKLDELDHNPDITEKLCKLSKHDNFPHMIFCGPSGAGKKTRVMAFLREFYGDSVDHIKIDRRNFKTTQSNKHFELRTLQSNHHIEINPSDVGIYDEIVVQEIIKEIAQYRSLSDQFKVVLITEADKLSHKAQHGLRATIEKYSEYCKIIMVVESISKIIDPILSRCSVLRVPSPTKSEICEILNVVAKQENVELGPQLTVNIVNKTDRNLRRAILTLESLVKISTKSTCKTIKLDESMPVIEADWEKYIDNLAYLVVKKPEPKTLLEARKKIYELLSNCIPATIIFKRLCYLFIIDAKHNDDLKRSIIYWCAHYEASSIKGQKSIYFLEAFIAKIMVLFI